MGDRVKGLSARLAFWGVMAISLWLFARWILMADRGLDLGDESLYLLEASAPQSTASYVFPFGWHTGPLFDAVGGDVPDFRVAGAVLLAFVGIWAGTGAAEVIEAARKQRDRLIIVGSGVAGAAASWMFYFTLLRAPGYNWVTLMGIAITLGAALRQWAATLQDPEDRSRWHGRILFAIAGFGIVFSLAAKPTTPIFLGITYGLTALSIVGFRRAMAVSAWLVVSAFAWIPILVAIRWWPIEFPLVFWDAAHRPLVTENQTPLRAAVNFFSIPLFAYRDFRGVAALPVLIAAVCIAALVTNVIRQWRTPRLILVPFALVMGITPAFAANSLQVWQQGWERGNLTVAFFVVVLATYVIGLGAWVGHQKVTRIQLTIAVASLVVLAGAFGYSSTNTPYPMMKFAAIPLVVATMLPLARVSDNVVRRVISATIAVAMSITSVHLILMSQAAPYSSLPLQDQTHEVAVGRTTSMILLDHRKAAVLSAIRDELASSGVSNPRVVAVGPSTPGLAFASGATVPESIMLSWFGLPGDEALAEANLSRIERDEWCDAWLITAPVTTGSQVGQTERIANLFANFLGRNWPQDYTNVVTIDDFRLWRPAEPCYPASASTN